MGLLDYAGVAIEAAIKEAVENATAPLIRRIELLEACTDEWVDTKMALRLTGIKSRTTLALERDRPGTALEYEGFGKAIRYSRSSCVAFTEQRRLSRSAPKSLLKVTPPTPAAELPAKPHRQRDDRA